MVTWWFNGARADASYMHMLETTYKDVDVKAMLDEAELKMKNTRSKQGRKGQRRGDLHQWLVNDRNSFATRYTWNRKTN